MSNAYKTFEVEAVKWHAMETKNKMNHVANFRKYSPSLEEHLNKPIKSVRKPNESKRRTKRDADIIIVRIEKKTRKCKGLRILMQNDLLYVTCFSDQWYLV